MENALSSLIKFKSRKILIAQKPSGMSSQINRDSNKSLQDLLEIYLKRKINIISRLDRPVSGLVVFAMDKKSASVVSEWQRNKWIQKKYLALVEKRPTLVEGKLEHFLVRNAKNRKAIVQNVKVNNAKKAVLHYKVLKSFENYSLLAITPDTGRFHQIRAQLAYAGFPIKGDVKYGARRSNKDKSIHLHCHQIELKTKEGEKPEAVFADTPTSDGLWLDVSKYLIDSNES